MVGEVRRPEVDAEEERLVARRPFADESDAVIRAAPGGGLLLGRVQDPAYALPPAREVDVHHGIGLPLPHRGRRHVTVEAVLLGRPVFVNVPLPHVIQGVAAVPQQS